MTFAQKLGAIFQFGATQVLPLAVKDAAKQQTVLGWAGVGVVGIALVEALFSHSVTPTTTTTTNS